MRDGQGGKIGDRLGPTWDGRQHRRSRRTRSATNETSSMRNRGRSFARSRRVRGAENREAEGLRRRERGAVGRFRSRRLHRGHDARFDGGRRRLRERARRVRRRGVQGARGRARVCEDGRPGYRDHAQPGRERGGDRDRGSRCAVRHDEPRAAVEIAEGDQGRDEREGGAGEVGLRFRHRRPCPAWTSSWG